LAALSLLSHPHAQFGISHTQVTLLAVDQSARESSGFSGTIAFGSFIIAVVEFIRLVFEYYR
jgi:hypothetical protein